MTRVLVVEDEESYSDALSYMLRKEGFEVAVAATSGRATARPMAPPMARTAWRQTPSVLHAPSARATATARCPRPVRNAANVKAGKAETDGVNVGVRKALVRVAFPGASHSMGVSHVYVLTGPETASGCEDLAYALASSGHGALL